MLLPGPDLHWVEPLALWDICNSLFSCQIQVKTKKILSKCGAPGQARSQDLEKGGGAILKEWEVCKRPWLEFSLTLNQFQTVCQNLRQNVSKRSKIQPFFPPKIRWSPKKKKKKKKKKVFAKIQGDFSSKISQVQTFQGGLFSHGGGYFQFFTENRPQKHKKHAILHTSQANGGGSSPPPAPPLATLLAPGSEPYVKSVPG